MLSAPALVSLALPPVPLLAGSLHFLADFVMRSLTDLSTDPPGEVASGRLDAALRPGRTRFPCVPPAAGTLVLLRGGLKPDAVSLRAACSGDVGVAGGGLKPDAVSLRAARSGDIGVAGGGIKLCRNGDTRAGHGDVPIGHADRPCDRERVPQGNRPRCCRNPQGQSLGVKDALVAKRPAETGRSTRGSSAVPTVPAVTVLSLPFGNENTFPQAVALFNTPIASTWFRLPKTLAATVP